MKAVVFDKQLSFTDSLPVPKPLPGEALIKTLMGGICNTDLEILRGYMGFIGIPGHEFVGVVQKAEGARRLEGKRVVGEINCGCGACSLCMQGLSNHCPGRSVLGILGRSGAFAQYLTLPVGNLHEVPEGVPDEEAVFTEPLAAAFRIPEQVSLKPTDRVLVMGDGKLGILIALVLKLSCPHVTLLGKHGEKLAIARAQGVKTVLLIDLNTGDFKTKRAYDVVVEATGSEGGLACAMGLVRPGGVIVLKSTVAGEGRQINPTLLVVDEITVLGSRCGPFKPALKALSEKLVDVRPLITDVFKFEQAGEAFARAMQRDSLKVLLQI